MIEDQALAEYFMLGTQVSIMSEEDWVGEFGDNTLDIYDSNNNLLSSSEVFFDTFSQAIIFDPFDEIDEEEYDSPQGNEETNDDVDPDSEEALYEMAQDEQHDMSHNMMEDMFVVLKQLTQFAVGYSSSRTTICRARCHAKSQCLLGRLHWSAWPGRSGTTLYFANGYELPMHHLTSSMKRRWVKRTNSQRRVPANHCHWSSICTHAVGDNAVQTFTATGRGNRHW